MPSTSHLILPDGSIHELFGPPCAIGRHASNDIAIESDLVSRHHALVQWQQGIDGADEGGFLLVDLGSSNGTSVNGRRVAGPVFLANGDIIELSDCRFEFRSDDLAGEVFEKTYGSTVIDIKKRKIWLMVADIIGSTRRSIELEVEDVPRINGNWFASCRKMVESRGGHMNQYLGDGFLCYWEDTTDARTQIPKLLREFSKLQAEASPPFRVVLHFGLTVLGNVPTLSSLNLHGPQVNFVFRMEKLAGSLGEELLLSAAACEGLALPVRSNYQAELAGFDGIFDFLVPDLGL